MRIEIRPNLAWRAALWDTSGNPKTTGCDVLGPTLRGSVVTLEAAQTGDLPVFCGWFADLEVTRFLLMRFVPSLGQEEEWYQNIASSDAHVHWKITIGGGRTIGVTGIHEINWIHRRASTGMLVGDRSQWGKGYGSETVALRTAYAFRELGLESLETSSIVDNVGMHRALEKSGYQKIGRRRRYIYSGGEWRDAFLFELLKGEWESANALRAGS